jgi:hypothetical protein
MRGVFFESRKVGRGKNRKILLYEPGRTRLGAIGHAGSGGPRDDVLRDVLTRPGKKRAEHGDW